MKNAAAITGLVLLVLMGLGTALSVLAMVTSGTGPSAAEYGGSYVVGYYIGRLAFISLGGWALYRLFTRGNRAERPAGPKTFTPGVPAGRADQQ